MRFFGRKKQESVKPTPAPARLIPLVFNGAVLTSSAQNTIRTLLNNGFVVILCKNVNDYTDNGLPLLFGRGVILRLDKDVMLVRYQFTKSWFADQPVEHEQPVRTFKFSDFDALNQIFSELQPYLIQSVEHAPTDQ